MPIFMDVHIVPGVKARDVAEAHSRDVMLQEEHECKCMTYWVDEKREKVFCLIEAPHSSAVEELHARSHGLTPNKIIEVNSSLVESFLGRIYDPAEAEISAEGYRVFHDPSFRILMVARTTDPILLRHCLGKKAAGEILEEITERFKNAVTKFEGREAEHSSNRFIASFTSAAKAVSCAREFYINIARKREQTSIGVGIHAGEPVSSSGILFGDTIRRAELFCNANKHESVAISSLVTDLISKEQLEQKIFRRFSVADEELLELIFSTLESNYADEGFNVDGFCRETAMSNANLYRKSLELTSLSPNQLLKEFRLTKALELLRKDPGSIAQVTYNCGFASPSYFTKCFRKQFGLLPHTYIELSDAD